MKNVIVCDRIDLRVAYGVTQAVKSILQPAVTQLILRNFVVAETLPVNPVQRNVMRQKLVQRRFDPMLAQYFRECQRRVAFKIPQRVVKIKENVGYHICKTKEKSAAVNCITI